MAPSVLDYISDSPTFALAFSPLSTDTQSLKLAVGSFNETRGANNNNLTIVQLDPQYLDLEDDYDESAEDVPLPPSQTPISPNLPGLEPRYARNRHTGTRVQAGSAFVGTARASLPYPSSALAFSPAKLSNSLQNSSVTSQGESTREMVASSSECLRLWDIVGDDVMSNNPQSGHVGQGRRNSNQTRLVQRAMLANSKQDYSAPLTSFSWSTLEPNLIVTASIDTTCTVWDIATGVPVTQLIAHDREVYDVMWSPSHEKIFASVGADGSVRMFDLRSLEHSTILYEATTPAAQNTAKNGTNPTSSTTSPNSNSSAKTSPSPLLRLAFSPTSPTYLSVCHADSSHVQILDTRSPGVPIFEVRGHTGSVNGMAWGGSTFQNGGETSGPGWLATVADDCTLLLWDLSNATPSPTPASRSTPIVPKVIPSPVLAYTAPTEINAVAWGGGGDWVAAGCGRLVRCLRV